jgi:polyhydroxyalkanoate synthase
MQFDQLTAQPRPQALAGSPGEGSWWPEWRRWLADRPGERQVPPAMLGDAPGSHVPAP